MAIAITLKSYLDSHHVQYDTVEHVHTESAMDSAKVIAAGVTNNKPVAKMEGPFKVRKPPLPLFAVPTTSGTGAEVTVSKQLNQLFVKKAV